LDGKEVAEDLAKVLEKSDRGEGAMEIKSKWKSER